MEEHGERIASADRAAFERWALIRVPIGPGTALMAAATAAGLVLASIAYYLDAPWNGVALVTGGGALIVTTHGLAHLVVGRLVGIRFTHWFIGSVAKPHPGVKIDYASYLATRPRARAWMHASGAITTKVVPFILLGEAFAANVPWWTWTFFLVVGIAMLITDITLSPTRSDWKRFRREMRVARSLARPTTP